MEELIINLLNQNLIIDTVNRLFIYTDNKDWEKVKECFYNEVLFDMKSASGEEPVILTPAQIAEMWNNELKNLDAVHHQAGNFRVKLLNNNADGFCYGIAIHYRLNSTNQNTRTFVGSYDFHLVKKNNIWLIDKFKFNLKFMEGNLNLHESPL